ncbi:MAG: hypothetical protein SFY81_07210 [Verrucomicrobiota bacterium]|nr:hypothetical protein [Verrucomicrobiota bacterium]
MTRLLQSTCLLLLGGSIAIAASPVLLRVDTNTSKGIFKPLHGVNKGPLASGGLIDLTAEHRTLGIPFTRLHDCHWPNPDVVDIHTIFPDPTADPLKESSYDFRLTDEYISAVIQSGASIVFRLGESIEHTSIKRFVHPPQDAQKWAEICAHIVRHYNQGWAGGHHYGIQYWEIWNEPDNRPAMWTGTDQQFLQLYSVTARLLKTRFPHLKIGGPGLGNSGSLNGNQLVPAPFMTLFLDFCASEKLPLDFFSWHCYTDNSQDFLHRAKAIRQALDSRGFTKTESHLNEWNYLPNNNWSGLMKNASAEQRERFYREMSGSKAATFALATLTGLQDAPVDIANFFHGELGGFGLFTEHGVRTPVFNAFFSFNRFLTETPDTIDLSENADALFALAGKSKDNQVLALLVGNNGTNALPVIVEGIPGSPQFSATAFWLSGTEQSLAGTKDRKHPWSFSIPAAQTALIQFKRAQ